MEFTMNETISRELLEILACPKCKGEIELDRQGRALICRTCRLVYEIREGIPVMLIEEAKALNNDNETDDA